MLERHDMTDGRDLADAMRRAEHEEGKKRFGHDARIHFSAAC